MDTTYTVPLHQTTPITAASFSSQEPVCDSIPPTEDGWHFVLPGNFTRFNKLTVTFSPGGTQTITTFGPPSAKHAFAGSPVGAKLISASAIVTTATGHTKVAWFNLSHTCPGTKTPPPPPPHHHHKKHHHKKHHHKRHHHMHHAPVPAPVHGTFPVTG